MIFVTLGSQKFQFNRLLVAVDELVEKEVIKEKVIAQIGYSDYIPRNYDYEKFLDREEFDKRMKESNFVITHSGTGAIMSAVNYGKKVIAVPRNSLYGEHVDDHQLQILKQFEEMNIICACYDPKDLGRYIEEIEGMSFIKYKSNTHVIIESIDQYIKSVFKSHYESPSKSI
ncbi:PssE/Cps14G family polysaccharide biosynthesis glycosyltransferase [Clostridium sp. Marseille-P299]|uniref:PssE/Cps14G family polysaccharide biosynthesis glycosyltransferase n=1 Tax=Clostridium sp. Marseille-P299 TaxID=1805477 RepID=UPI00082AC283|nr:PssE/Cps14G family polysaccharide biosynthesis glycosyltransferase [Clostridium sp. Marseille-P299]